MYKINSPPYTVLLAPSCPLSSYTPFNISLINTCGTTNNFPPSFRSLNNTPAPSIIPKISPISLSFLCDLRNFFPPFPLLQLFPLPLNHFHINN